MHFPRIEELRLQNELTQQEVANYLHCQREVYRRYEKGIYELPLCNAILLARLYKVSIDYLVSESDK